MKKIVALLLALTMLCSMAACGSNAESASSSDAASSEATAQQPAQSTAASTPEADQPESAPEASEAEAAPESTISYPLADPVTLTALGAIYQPRTADKITSWSESLQYVEAAKATGVTIDMTCVASSAQQEQTQLVISSGDYPQLMTSLNMYYQVNDLVEQEIVIDLMPYLETYAPDYYQTIQDMGYDKDIITDDGVSPCTYYVNEGVPNTGMMIRKDLLEKAGLDIPVTYEDYDEVMAAFKDQCVKEPFVLDGTSTGCSDVYNAGLEVQLFSHPILGSGNDGFYQVDGQVKFGYMEEGFVTYMTQMADWFQKGYISPDYISENENNNAESFTGKIVAGDVGAVTAGRTNLDTYNTEGKANNALGGVTVNSDYAFSVGSYSYVQGENQMDGAKALAFVRERHAFASGDRQRGKNQMALIQAVIQKAMSPELLVNYNSVMDSLSGSFETSVPYDLISKVIRQQLSTGGSWTVSTYSVDGTGDSQVPYSMSQKAYVMVPDQSTVDTAKQMIQQVYAGE